MACEHLSDLDKAALVDAVKDVEGRSAAEVVIAVRGRSGSYRDADLIAGALLSCFTLWFLLFSPWEFDLLVILSGPLVAFGIGALLTSRAPNLRRLFSKRPVNRVLKTARATRDSVGTEVASADETREGAERAVGRGGDGTPTGLG